MGKTLIIAEKPAQGRAYAKALGMRGKGEDGFIANDRYVITWCIGHLLELEKPEMYMDAEKAGKGWSLARLPVLPAAGSFRYALKSQTSKQYQVIARLLKDPGITDVICGTDADREGQLLFQEVWDRVKCQKPLQRLWVSSLTDEAIREGMAKLRPASSVEGLAAAGYGRAFADWDFGMNLTEGFTALFGSYDRVRKKPNVISIGRVQTPTLALVVEREEEIDRFQVLKFYEVKGCFEAASGSFSGVWVNLTSGTTRILEKQTAEELAYKVSGNSGKIEKLTEREVQEVHPLLFDLTSLTISASKRYGFGAERVLNIAQSLYEKKAITYPRTDCNYLPADILPKLPAHLQALDQEPYCIWVKDAQKLGLPSGKRVINQISAHHAIIPTTEKVKIEHLTPDESKLYDLIVRRFLAVWFPPARYRQTEVWTEVVGERFQTKGKILIDSGWKAIYSLSDQDEKQNLAAEQSVDTVSTGKRSSARNGADRPAASGAARTADPSEKGGGESEDTCTSLPQLIVGTPVRASETQVIEKDTKPPKRYTQADLLKAMESAGKQVEDETLRQQLKGKGLGTVATRPAIIGNLLDRGYLLEEQKVLKPTAKGLELIRLIRGRLPRASVLVSAEMTGQMEYDLSLVGQGALSLVQYMASIEETICQIIEELREFERINGKVPLALAPPVSAKAANHSQRPKRAGRTTKTEAVKGSDTESEHPAQGAVSLGKCPLCAGEIIEGTKGYGCANWRQGCKWVIWKSPVCGKVLTPAQLKSLLKRGQTPLIKGFRSKSGRPFAAYLVWEDKQSGKLKFKFQERA